uniref:receptor protein-tyrosine kinase n=1 Tax=Onchocerca volvulus TaxID=6282 RepID=A0A8R1Y3H9_ONCVO
MHQSWRLLISLALLTPNLAQWANVEKICSGTDNSRTELRDPNWINQLIRQYENCTRVNGNLELTYIRDEHLNGTDPERFFSFLDHIRQAGVQRGQIVLMHNPYLCNWNTTVSYDELLGKPSESRVQLIDNFEECLGDIHTKCSTVCGKHCWGPIKGMCQIVYREICPEECPSQMCYQSKNETHCCDEECAGGCFGEGKSACIACAKLEQDSKCVDKCNGLTDYDWTLKMTVPHPDPRYTYDRYCVKQCPEETLIQGEYCVIHCAESYWHDPERNTRICEKCEHDICPKTCYLDEPIDSSNIGDLENCTLIEGFVEILRHPFEPHRKFFSDGRPPIDIEKLTVQMLKALSKVKIVTEYVNVQAADYSPESLNFLRSLRTIEGRKLPDQIALLVTSNHNLKQLGLRSLKKIKNGRVYIGNNPKLCYLDTINDYWKEIMQGNVTTDLKIISNQLPNVCENVGKICDETCDENYGCWGEGPTMCVKCADYEMDDKCSSFCPSEGYYVEGKKCQKCQSQCKTCNGPTTLNCTECLNIRMQQGNNWECLAKCPTTHYLHKNTCLPCSPACYNFGCTGPNAVAGKDGCNKCKYAKRFDHGKQLMCLHTTGKPKDVCRDNNLTRYYATASSNEMLVVEFECNECSEECLSCSGYGTSVNRHKCKCAHYLTKTTSGNEYCTMKCEMNSFMIRPKSLDTIGECERCHELCDPSMGCIGRTTANCTRCAKAGVLLENQLVCLEQCPINHPFIANDKICHTLDPEEQASKRRMYIIIISALCAAIFIVALVGITVKYIKYKKRYKEELEMNLPSIPEYEPMDPSMRPNMTRLCIITSENLEKTQQSLGQGAFGTVFLGYWWPKGKDDGEKLAVAIKVVNDGSSTAAHQEMLQEAGIMACMRHEHLLRLVGVCLSNGMQIVTPMRPLGSLKNYLKKHRQKLGARDLLLYCYQIASAMEYLYKNRLVHRDLAARNVLVKRTNHVEVTDFGLAKLLEKGKSEVVVGGKVAVKWLALESLEKQIYTHYTDVWAFGVTCWEVLTFGQTPFQSVPPDQIRKHLATGNRLEQPNNCTQEVYQTFLQCWLRNPESRPSFVILKEKFNQYCKAPHLYVLDRHYKQQFESVLLENQHELTDEMMYNNELPDQFKFSGITTTTTSTSVPPSPTTPCWVTFQQGDINMQQERRLGSTDSGRYQSDPVCDGRTELSMDEGNYLVPNNKLILYTPVVVRENGETELMESAEYYNDKLGTDYYNQLRSLSQETKEKAKSIKIATYQNDYYFAETETSL